MDSRLFKQTNDESGTIGATISAAEVTTLTLSPVPAKAPGVICLRPGTAYEEYIFYRKRDAGAGTVTGLIRDYTNLNSGVGREHLNGAAWETMQMIEPINNIIDALQEGWMMESQTFTKVDSDTFTIEGNQTAFYTAGRFVRYNQLNTAIGKVTSSSYNAGTGLTTVEVTGATVPTLTSLEMAGFQSKGFTGTTLLLVGEDAGDSDAYAITVLPNFGAYFTGMVVLFKAHTANTGACTLNVNSLGAKTIKKLLDQDLEDGDVSADQWIMVIYDGTNFQLVSALPVGGAVVSSMFINQSSDPDAPDSGQIKIFSKTDGRIMQKDSSSVVRPIGENAWEALTDGATVTLDWSTSSKKILKAIGGNRTIAHSNIVAGRFIAFFCRQDGTGSRIPVWDATGSEVFAPESVNVADNKITVTEDVPTGTPIKFTTATTLPAGLTAGTQYYAINIDSTHISVATSVANAQAGTAVDITDQGTGNHTVHYYIKWDGGVAPTMSVGKFNMDKIVFQSYSTKIIGGSIAGQGEI